MSKMSNYNQSSETFAQNLVYNVSVWTKFSVNAQYTAGMI